MLMCIPLNNNNNLVPDITLQFNDKAKSEKTARVTWKQIMFQANQNFKIKPPPCVGTLLDTSGFDNKH